MSSEPDVVEFGPASVPAPPRRELRWHAVVSSRLTTVALAAVGAGAALASLVAEWQTIDTGAGPEGDYFVPVPRLANSVWSVPAGPVYLVGLMLLAAAVAVALYGPPRGRAAARVAGLGLAVALFAVVAAAASALTEPREVPQFWAVEAEMLNRFTVRLGQGVVAALAGIALLGFALLTAHRAEPVAHPAAPRDDDDEPDDGEPRDVELTVATAAPFIRQY